MTITVKKNVTYTCGSRWVLLNLDKKKNVWVEVVDGKLNWSGLETYVTITDEPITVINATPNPVDDIAAMITG